MILDCVFPSARLNCYDAGSEVTRKKAMRIVRSLHVVRQASAFRKWCVNAVNFWLHFFRVVVSLDLTSLWRDQRVARRNLPRIVMGAGVDINALRHECKYDFQKCKQSMKLRLI